jgi:hypothetical protein
MAAPPHSGPDLNGSGVSSMSSMFMTSSLEFLDDSDCAASVVQEN